MTSTTERRWVRALIASLAALAVAFVLLALNSFYLRSTGMFMYPEAIRDALVIVTIVAITVAGLSFVTLVSKP